MDRLIELVNRYATANARHRTKGYRLGEITDERILAAAVEELAELRGAPHDLDEMADLLGCLLHYCLRRGWSAAELYVALERKLRLRFTDLREYASDPEMML